MGLRSSISKMRTNDCICRIGTVDASTVDIAFSVWNAMRDNHGNKRILEAYWPDVVPPVRGVVFCKHTASHKTYICISNPRFL